MTMKFSIAIVLFTILGFSTAQLWFEESKIVNGKLATNADFPYLVQILYKDKFICGGSIVADNQIVTAAHCVAGKGASNLQVIGGATFLYFGTTRNVVHVVLTAAWDRNTGKGDVAVLKIDSPFGGTTKPIPICQQPIATAQSMTISGWGYEREGGQSSYQVQTITKPVSDLKSCQRSYSNIMLTVGDQGMFCISNSNGEDACQGDSGGPAVYKNQLCGIVSFANGCARAGYPGVYTDVYYYRRFIAKAITL